MNKAALPIQLGLGMLLCLLNSQSLGQVCQYSDLIELEQAIERLPFQRLGELSKGAQMQGDSCAYAFALGLIASRCTDYGNARDHFERAHEYASNSETAGLSLFWVGVMDIRLGEFLKASNSFLAMSSGSENITLPPYLQARQYQGLGEVWSQQGKHEEAGIYFAQASEWVLQSGSEYDKLFLSSDWATLLFRSGDAQGCDSISVHLLDHILKTDYPRRRIKHLNMRLSCLTKLGNDSLNAGIIRQIRALNQDLKDSLITFDLAYKKEIIAKLGFPEYDTVISTFVTHWQPFLVRSGHIKKQLLMKEAEASHALYCGRARIAAQLYFEASTLAFEHNYYKRALDFSGYSRYCSEEANFTELEGAITQIEINALKKLKSNRVSSLDFLEYANTTVIRERELIEARLRAQQLKLRQVWGAAVGIVVVLLALLAYRHQRTRRKTAQLELAQQEQEAQQEVQSLLERHRYENLVAQIQGEESERDRLAKEIHDGVGGVLAGIALKMESEHGNSPGISELTKALRQTHEDLRNISHNLALPALEDNSLVELSKELLAGLRNMHGYEIGFTVFPDSPMRLDPQLEVQLYRVLQELTNNIVKHAQASQVEVSFTLHPDELNLMVADNGKGFDPATVKTGLGQRTVRERVAPFGGTVRVESTPGNGTTATVVIPDPKRRET